MTIGRLPNRQEQNQKGTDGFCVLVRQMSYTSGSGGEYSISTKRGRELMVMTNKVLEEKEIRGEVEEKGRYRTMAQTETRSERSAKEAFYEVVLDTRSPGTEGKGRCHPLLKQMNLCNSGLVGFTAPREVTEAAVGAAGAHRCSSTSFNVMPCRYR
jgi:hypothetical protein